MSARLAPVVGMAAACAMLTGIGVVVMVHADNGGQSQIYAGAVVPLSVPSSSAPTHPASKAVAPASRAVPVPAMASSTPAAPPVADPTSAPATSAPPASTVSTVSSAAAASSPSSPSATTSQAGSASQPQLMQPADGGAAAADSEAGSSPGGGQYALAVFRAINRARHAQHLPELVWSSKLELSAHRHNLAMAGANKLAQRVGSEPALGARETAVGVSWTFAAENIGWTTERSAQGALDIEARMLAEAPPADGHRRNILSSQATAVGVDAYLDVAHGRLWLTEDFSDAS